MRRCYNFCLKEFYGHIIQAVKVLDKLENFKADACSKISPSRDLELLKICWKNFSDLWIKKY